MLSRDDQPKARLILVETLHFQDRNGETAPFECRHAKALMSEEQPYLRKLNGSAEWKRLDLGWVGRPSEVCIRNDGKELLHVSFDGATLHVTVEPGRSSRFQPETPIWLRGDTKITYVVYPS